MRTIPGLSFKALLSGLMIVLLLQSCKKDDQLGLDIINLPGDRFGFDFTDTTTVTAWTMVEDSLQTSGVIYHLLGNYYDPVFGKVTAGIYTQALLSNNNVSFGANPVGDSLVLTLQFAGFYGDSTASHRLKIYEIDPSATFSKDSVYYSNRQLPLGDLLFDQMVPFNPKDSVEFGGKMVTPLLKVRLYGNLMQKFIDKSGTSDLSNNDAFRNFFKGLYITVDDIHPIGSGSIGYFSMNADLTRMTLYYHNDQDTLSYPFVINDECAKFSRTDHMGYQHAEAGIRYQDTNGVNDRLYLQAMGGLKIRVKFPHIKDLYKDGNVAITRAELVFRLDPSDATSASFAQPPKLAIARINDEGKNAFISDVLEGETFLGGNYDQVKQEYRFRVTRHLQDILNGRYENHGLVVMASAAAVRANRAVILGNTPAVQNVRLEIVHTTP